MSPNLGFGVGYRPPHYSHVLENQTSIDWFEVISENFMGLENSGNWGRHRQFLEKLRACYPVVLHGVSLSIGSTDPLNFEYLQRLKKLADEIQPAWMSDHFCWTGVQNENLHDLLPLPYTEEAVAHVSSRITQVQDFLKREMTFENVSSYVSFAHSEMTEWEFISKIVKRTGCKVLLDVNNVYVSSFNHKFNPHDFINGIPINAIQQVHLAGHTNEGTHLIDTHDYPVCNPVWELYELLVRKIGPVPTLIEWDANIPEFSILENEANQARKILSKVLHESSPTKTKLARTSAMDALDHH